MRRIEPLPEAVRSSVRSGIILYDLTRVVEELIFNSLDAGATKVYVAVGVGTCFVKVVDNGCGIDRDGLTLLGERYATSRHGHFGPLDSRGSFGFHGEALSSIADVSLLEITTKAPGMPHGYRKIMKGCKCLYLGINDDYRDVGTIVIVRDLFYNQPVRRRHMQLSPKKALHSVKKCVLRIALVHSTVSFRVANIESEDDLLRTGSSPLQLLTSNFGIEANKHLHEIEVGEGELRLSGYISGPCGISSLKALQYIYINSRFVCKGPIHKLLNQLAAGYVDDRKLETSSEYEKRRRSQMCPTFILDLSCPRSDYELTFEPTKNLVEFRDWGSVLHFIQNAVTRFWTESISNDMLTYSESTKKRQRTQKWLDPFGFRPLDRLKKLEDWDNLPAPRKILSSYNTSDGVASQSQKLQAEALVIHNTSNVVHSCSSSIFHFEAAENDQMDCNLQLSDHCHSDKDNVWEKEFYTADVSNVEVGSLLGPRWQEEPFEADDKMDNTFIGGALLDEWHEFTDVVQVNGHCGRSSQFSSMTQRNLPHHGPSSTSEVRFESESDDLEVPEKLLHYAESDEIGEEDGVDQIFGEKLLREDEAKKGWSFSRCTTLNDIGINVELAECFVEDKHIEPGSLQYIRACSSNDEWTPQGLCPLIDTKFRYIDKFSGEDVFGSPFEYGKDISFPDIQSNHICSVGPIVQGRGQDGSPVPRCKEILFDDYNCFWGGNNKFKEHESKGSSFPTCSEVHVDSLPDSSDPFSLSLSAQSNKNKCRQIQARKQARSFSAPPFYRCRKKFFVLDSSLRMSTGKTLSPAANKDSYFPESTKLRSEKSFVGSSSMRHQRAQNGDRPSSSRLVYVDDSFLSATKLESSDNINTEPQKGLASNLHEDILDYGWKCRSNYAESESGVKSHSTEVQDAVLNIDSGILYLSGDLLVPNSISRNDLEKARVLLQVDKKFIPAVAGRTLAIIDQHAADERIRLEELRTKVLSGEMKQITYLEAEQELVLPEIGNQLLHSYSEEIENWGWICRIDGEGSRSFTKNLNFLSRQQSIVKLVAVPCILGVNLTDVDLMEFLQQLADTDGSSTLPPSVHRVLINKACRGAIMFGDTLLPSECSLIVEELKQKSLCFQCAHGRPTTVPLVDLAILHRQIDSLELCSRDTKESWHGLRRHEISLARAAHRLTPTVD